MARMLNEQVLDLDTEKWFRIMDAFRLPVNTLVNPIQKINKYISCDRCGANKIKDTKCEYCGQ